MDENQDKPLIRGDMCTDHLKLAWRHATLAFNTAQNAKAHQDTLYGLAFVIATISQQLEFRETMAKHL